MMGLKENIVYIPYDIITSVKLKKNILSSTIRFKVSLNELSANHRNIRQPKAECENLPYHDDIFLPLSHHGILL